MGIAEEAKSMADDLDNMRGSVTDWEADFLESILKRLDDGDWLSDPQFDCLERMHRKYSAQRAFD